MSLQTAPESTKQPKQQATAYSLRFLKAAYSPDNNVEWIWDPKKDLSPMMIKTATFSGKNKADDYTNE